MNIESEIDILTEITGIIDNYYGGGGQQEITSKPKWLPATYNFIPLQIVFKERTENE